MKIQLFFEEFSMVEMTVKDFFKIKGGYIVVSSYEKEIIFIPSYLLVGYVLIEKEGDKSELR